MINGLANGHIVEMKVSDPLHYSGRVIKRRSADDVSGSFSDLLNNAVKKVNDLQVNAEENMQKMIYEPEKIDIHQVMIANQKAEVSLAFTKAVRDGVLNAYRELANLR